MTKCLARLALYAGHVPAIHALHTGIPKMMNDLAFDMVYQLSLFRCLCDVVLLV